MWPSWIFRIVCGEIGQERTQDESRTLQHASSEPRSRERIKIFVASDGDGDRACGDGGQLAVELQLDLAVVESSTPFELRCVMDVK